MHQFSVWAPLATQVAVESDGVAYAMQGPDDCGWWRRRVDDAGPGSEYGYLLDGDTERYPDPRSEWQPNGVHELSRVYDQDAFAWGDAGFQAIPLAGAIIYELHIGTFTMEGTFDAAVGKLAYLAELGITHVELMPVAAFDGHHGWGYDGVALFSVHEPYGGADGLKRFVDAAHGAGLAVLLDVVYNHFGPSGNYSGKFGPYIISSHHTPWGGAVNLEAEWSSEVRRFFCDNAFMWLRDFHIDGLRIDAVHAFVDRSAIHFLEQLAMEVDALEGSLGRHLLLIAESDLNDPRVVTPREAGGYGIDAQWSDDFHHALFAALSPNEQQGYYADFGTLEQLAKSIERTFVYDGIYSRHRLRVHGRPAAALSQNRFLGYIQNHDQVGNRVVGDRISQVAGIERAKIAAAMYLLSPFVPMLFQGEEWAASTPFLYFADHQDTDLARAVSDGRKKEFAAFGWNPASVPDPESQATFNASRLCWDEATAGEHAEMLSWYRALIRLRRKTPCLNDGTPGNAKVTFDEQARWLRMKRGTITVVCNIGEREQVFDVSQESQVILASQGAIRMSQSKLILPPDSVAALSDYPSRNA